MITSRYELTSSKYLQAEFEVFEADNGTDGLELVYHLVPDIVISDVMMQGLSGIEALQPDKGGPRFKPYPRNIAYGQFVARNKIEGHRRRRRRLH
jgi:CheY-like chemotaxis protein